MLHIKRKKIQQIAADVKKLTMFCQCFKMFFCQIFFGNKGVLLLSLIGNGINWHIFLACEYKYTFHPLNNVFRYNNIFAITIFWWVTKDIVIAKLDCTGLFILFCPPGTPLIELYRNGSFTNSKHYLVHLSDGLRLAYVFKVREQNRFFLMKFYCFNLLVCSPPSSTAAGTPTPTTCSSGR